MLTKLKQLYLANTQVLHGAAALTVLLLVAAVCAAFAFAKRSTQRRGWNTHGRHTKLPADEVCVDEEEHFTESTIPLPATILTEESVTITGHANLPVNHRAVRIVQAPLQTPSPLPPPLLLPLPPLLPPLPLLPLPPPLPSPLLQPPLRVPLPQQVPAPDTVQTDDAEEVYSL